MKKIIHTILLFFLYNTAFCQNPPPPDFGDPTDPNPTDHAVPIDDQVPMMMITAVFFGICVIAKKKERLFNRFTN